jgi:hypothetical protein
MSKWNERNMKEWLVANSHRPNVVEKAITKIHGQQTTAEQENGMTSELNGVGWGGADAEFATKMANLILSGRSLSVRQREVCLKLALRYRRQLATIANAEGRVAAPPTVRKSRKAVASA